MSQLYLACKSVMHYMQSLSPNPFRDSTLAFRTVQYLPGIAALWIHYEDTVFI